MIRWMVRNASRQCEDGRRRKRMEEDAEAENSTRQAQRMTVASVWPLLLEGEPQAQRIDGAIQAKLARAFAPVAPH